MYVLHLKLQVQLQLVHMHPQQQLFVVWACGMLLFCYFFISCALPTTALPATAHLATATALVKYLSPDSAQMKAFTTNYSLCRTVFGAYGVRVFLCFWHVKRSWLKNLHRKCPRSVQYQMFLSMGKIMLMLPSIDQSKESFTQQVSDAVDTFCTQYAEQADYVSYYVSKSSGERRQG